MSDGWGISIGIELSSEVCKSTQWWWVNIGSGNGLVPSGNKPLPKPMQSKIIVAIWCLNELNNWSSYQITELYTNNCNKLWIYKWRLILWSGVCSKVNSLHSPSLNPLGQPVLVYGSMGSLNIKLTHWGLVTPYSVMNFDNIGSCNGLSPDDIKPLLDAKLISSMRRKFQCIISKMSSGLNELTSWLEKRWPTFRRQ